MLRMVIAALLFTAGTLSVLDARPRGGCSGGSCGASSSSATAGGWGIQYAQPQAVVPVFYQQAPMPLTIAADDPDVSVENVPQPAAPLYQPSPVVMYGLGGSGESFTSNARPQRRGFIPILRRLRR